MEILFVLLAGATAVLTLLGMASGLNQKAASIYSVLVLVTAILSAVLYGIVAFFLFGMGPYVLLVLSGKTYSNGEITNRNEFMD